MRIDYLDGANYASVLRSRNEGLQQRRYAAVAVLGPKARGACGKHVLVLLSATILVTGCATPPPKRTVLGPAPLPVSLVYPARGQSPQQLERDRYECHLWAVEQSGYDPSRQLPMERVDVQPGTPPGAGLAIGAIAGAIFGAAVAGPRSTGTGALLGGVAGAAIGASTDANAKTSAAAEQSRSDAYYARDQAAIASYQRANGVCLEGRGYSVG